jgi:hypothetical protein
MDYTVAGDLKKKLLRVARLVDFRILDYQDNEDASADMEVFLVVETLDDDVKTRISDVIWDAGYQHMITISYVLFSREDAAHPDPEHEAVVRRFTEEGVRI